MANQKRTSTKRTASRGTSSAGRTSQRKTVKKAAPSRSRTASAGTSRRSSKSRITTDHEEIQRWAEERNAHPAIVKATRGKGGSGVLRLDFPGYSGQDSLQEIGWDEFFKLFDANGLALLYQEKTATGRKSNFNKLVSRDQAE
jgi:hypothetical protein